MILPSLKSDLDSETFPKREVRSGSLAALILLVANSDD